MVCGGRDARRERTRTVIEVIARYRAAHGYASTPEGPAPAPSRALSGNNRLYPRAIRNVDTYSVGAAGSGAPFASTRPTIRIAHGFVVGAVTERRGAVGYGAGQCVVGRAASGVQRSLHFCSTLLRDDQTYASSLSRNRRTSPRPSATCASVSTSS